MTAPEFRAVLAHLGMQQNWLAAELGVSVHTVKRWATQGRWEVPRHVEAYLDLLLYPDERAAVLADAKAHSEASATSRMRRLAEGRAKRRQNNHVAS